jgi:hypothetical protein
MPLTQPGFKLFNKATEEEWLSLLIRSIKQPVIDGIEMPRYPHGDTQPGSVGSADETAMRDGLNFWYHVKVWSAALGIPQHEGSMVLDYGSGWGRYAPAL